jgi:putative hydrolase of the HAD superfamily
LTGAQKTIIWDFDGTLVTFTSWRFAMLDVLNECEPGHRINDEQFRPFLRNGFPWHKPDEPHLHLSTSEDWWANLEPVFARAYQGVGFAEQRSQYLARKVRKYYVDPRRFVLFDDTLPTLRYLYEKGWHQGILSNHVPELPEIARALGLSPFIDFCLTSGVTGYEKPHPQAFRLAISAAGNPEKIWMVGDSLVLDIQGAERLHIPAILVRQTPAEKVKYQASDLRKAIEIIEIVS